MKKILGSICVVVLSIMIFACSKDNSDTPVTDNSIKALSVVTYTPNDGATWVETGSRVSVDFDGPVDQASLNENNFTIKDSEGRQVTGKTLCVSNQISFMPNDPLANLEKYTVTVGPGIKNTEGKSLGKAQTFSFTTMREIEKNALQEKFVKNFGKSSFITLIALRANKYVDWSSPMKLAVSTGLSTLDRTFFSEFRHPIGHVMFIYGSHGYVAGYGQTGQQNGQETELMKAGFGITAMTNIVYTDGELQGSDIVNENIETVVKAKGASNFGWITFIVDEDAINKIEAFLEEYKDHEAYKNFGFPVDPKKYEGGGCSSFVNANLSASGIDFPMIDNWKRSVWIPWVLMGYDADRLKKISQVKYVGPDLKKRFVGLPTLWETMKAFAGGWASEGDGYEFIFLDPELYYRSCSLLENYKAGKTVKEIYPNDQERTQMIEGILQPYYEAHKDKIKIGDISGVSGVVIDLTK